MKSDIARTTHLRDKALAAILAAAALVLIIALPITPARAQITVKMATLVPEGTSWATIIKEAAEKWKKISNGRVIMNIYWGSVSGDDPDVVRKMRLGTLHAGLMTSVGMAEIDKSVYALSVPMMFASYEEVYAVLDKMRPNLEASIENKGFIVLNWVDGGWIHYFTQKPVATPDDLKKLKLFAWENDTDTVDILKGMGFNPQPMPTAEIAVGLQTGRINAVPLSPQAAVITQYYNYAKNMTNLDFELLLGATVIDKRTWIKIPADLRAPLLQVMQETGKKLRDEIRKSGERDVEEMKKRGLNVVPVDAKAREAWVKLTESAYPKLRERIVGAAAFDEALKYRDEYRKRPGTVK
jgi:TRAP-type C4-dicarboxylate transport system substrate-binding protein